MNAADLAIRVSDRIDAIIAKYAAEPQFPGLSFARGLYSCDSRCLGEHWAGRAIGGGVDGRLMIRERGNGDQRIRGLLLTADGASGRWQHVGAHSGDSACALVMDLASLHDPDEDRFAVIQDALIDRLRRNYRHTRSWSRLDDPILGNVLCVSSGYGTGGVEIYRRGEDLYLDYSGTGHDVEMETEEGIPEAEWEI